MDDLIIRGGTIVDGTGTAPYTGDIAIRDGRIQSLGDGVGSGSREIDAKAAMAARLLRRGEGAHEQRLVKEPRQLAPRLAPR